MYRTLKFDYILNTFKVLGFKTNNLNDMVHETYSFTGYENRIYFLEIFLDESHSHPFIYGVALLSNCSKKGRKIFHFYSNPEWEEYLGVKIDPICYEEDTTYKFIEDSQKALIDKKIS